MVNIILEGVDCCGKTSVAKILENRYYFKYVKRDAPKDKEDGLIQNYQDVIVLRDGDDYVFDRCFLGELVYAPMYRNYFPEYMRNLEKMVPDTTYLFVLTASEEVIKSRFDGKFISESHIKKIILDYEFQFEQCNVKNKYLIDTSKDSIEEIVKKIIEVITNGN